MKLFRNLSLGVALGALTVAGGLLGAAPEANAQGAPPGFFQVPGTNTALLITGQVGTRAIYDANDANVDYPALMENGSDILIPLFIPEKGNVSAEGGNNNGGFHFSSKDFSVGFITSTPTAWGPLSTVLIMGAGSNLDDPGPLNNAFQNVGVVVAFGTLGPWMAGMNGSLLSDEDASPDTMGEPLALAGQLGGIKPGIRYTWKGPNGFSVAASLEQNNSVGISNEAVGNFANQLFPISLTPAFGPGGQWGPDLPVTAGTLGSATTWPDFIAKVRWDQPWGHIALAGMIHQLTSSCTDNCNPALGYPGDAGSVPDAFFAGGNLPNYSKVGWALNLTGHVNTFGKDTLKGGLFFGQGVGDYMGDYGGNQGMQIGSGPACGGGTLAAETWCGIHLPYSWGTYLAYQHFWTDQMRSTLGAGYSHVENSSAYNEGQEVAPGVVVPLNQALMDNESHFSVVANLVWSPVPKVDLGVEYIYYRVTYLAPSSAIGTPGGNWGVDNRVEVEFDLPLLVRSLARAVDCEPAGGNAGGFFFGSSRPNLADNIQSG